VLGRYHFLKTTIRSGYHKRLQLVIVGIQKTDQHLFGHLGFACLSQWVWKFVPSVVFGNVSCRKYRYGTSSLEKGLLDLIWGVGEVLRLCFFVRRELVVAFK